jgi:endonuclease/exonuclease/phosphatase family metal-dependent hydrolase
MSAAATFSIVTLNIFHDAAEWPERLEVIVAGLRELGPDAVFLQEVLETAELPNQATTIAQRIGYHCHFVSADPAGAMKRFGNAILTRDAVLARSERLLEPRTAHRVAVHVRIACGDLPVDLYCTHLHYGPEGEIRARQIEDLLAFVESTRGDGPALVGGDLNAPPDASELRPLRDGWTDVFAALHPERGAGETTYNPHLGGDPPARIDQLWSSRGAAGAVVPVEAEIVFREPDPPGVWASDHFGVFVRLDFRRTPGGTTGDRFVLGRQVML